MTLYAALLALTLLTYALGLTLQRRWRSPLLNPTLTAAALLIPVLLLLGVPYGQYVQATTPLSSLLAPAVVALAVPMYRQRALLARQWRALLLGSALGTLTAVSVGAFTAHLVALERPVALALTTASATSPVALAVAQRLGGAPPLAATLAIVAGLIGAALLPALFDRLGLRSPLARGVAVGSVAHGIGTARMREESELAGAASTLGMGLGALWVTFVSAFLS
ncbi:LrgB family protein [Deinococcus peraridilitoris]|uniref:Putative effector of murein hydrolase n=1 Tax=Deinococcus peraridilitoris (strain DSM 19664 / LMG 22246 / CIP 109416 / KR-200) TaxID=937777 RepID=L0A6Q4_DEIPD|nr:LrgB family protein [Deinococcus peraridilitoris]AFZ68705.1 putative effector of murein hydrolase [Deinococcus peraridilitoris DSM 19664]